MIKRILFAICVLFAAASLQAQSLSLTVTTKTYNGSYKPKHVLTAWISNAAGYVKTLNIYGYNYLNELPNWTAVTASTKKTDGTTAATLGSHSQLTFNWNCKNASNTVVADGTYYINLEFTEGGSTKQYIKYSFVKGATAINTTSPTVVTANAYFTTPTLIYTPPAAAIDIEDADDFRVVLTGNTILSIRYNAAAYASPNLKLINLKGQQVYSAKLKGNGQESIGIPALKGLYFVKLTDVTGATRVRKLIF